jgi:ketopantoate reductase
MTTTDALRVAVLGPGGVGGLLAVLLARQGHDVVCLARTGTADHIDRNGLELISDRYGEVTARVRGAERLDEPVDVCLVTTKATQLATLAFMQSVPAEMRSSMQRDAEAGQPTELEAIGGAVLRAAERHGVDVPVTRRLVNALRDRLA